MGTGHYCTLTCAVEEFQVLGVLDVQGGPVELDFMGHRGKSVRLGCTWGGPDPALLYQDRLVNGPQSSAGIEGHNAHVMERPWLRFGHFLGATSRSCSSASCPCWVDEVLGGLNHQDPLPLFSAVPKLLPPGRTQGWLAHCAYPRPGIVASSHPRWLQPHWFLWVRPGLASCPPWNMPLSHPRSRATSILLSWCPVLPLPSIARAPAGLLL